MQQKLIILVVVPWWFLIVLGNLTDGRTEDSKIILYVLPVFFRKFSSIRLFPNFTSWHCATQCFWKNVSTLFIKLLRGNTSTIVWKVLFEIFCVTPTTVFYLLYWNKCIMVTSRKPNILRWKYIRNRFQILILLYNWLLRILVQTEFLRMCVQIIFRLRSSR